MAPAAESGMLTLCVWTNNQTLLDLDKLEDWEILFAQRQCSRNNGLIFLSLQERKLDIGTTASLYSADRIYSAFNRPKSTFLSLSSNPKE